MIVETLPIGTNLALYQFLWMLISGKLLTSRGAIFPALLGMGLADDEVRRAWAAFRYGAWAIGTMMRIWQTHVEGQGQWEAYQYAGYYVKAVDITAYWRPTLKGIESQHYDAQADRALPAVVLGMVGRVGHVGEQRMALLTDLVRGDLADPSETALQTKLLEQVAFGLADDEMPVFDAGFKIKKLFDAGLDRFVARSAKNFTARRNVLPAYSGFGRPPEYGEFVRPLARTYNGKQIEATTPDRTESWQHNGITFRAEFWDDLVMTHLKPSAKNETFMVAAIHDPRFEEPWLLACPLKLSGADLQNIYRARWPIEQLPLAAKHMVGAHRQFVFSEESCYRLPELSLLAGSIQTYLAATLPPIPTGFWDRDPKRTPGRLRRWLAHTTFSDLPLPESERIRRKSTVSSHLPKGILGHRRSKQPAPA
ncbi:MAG: hypothetical protein U9Q82_03100 [Chloroflexota bacterium]|nr:hypothetical protein [Chloroflexota bacterium]